MMKTNKSARDRCFVTRNGWTESLKRSWIAPKSDHKKIILMFACNDRAKLELLVSKTVRGARIRKM